MVEEQLLQEPVVGRHERKIPEATGVTNCHQAYWNHDHDQGQMSASWNFGYGLVRMVF